MTKRGGRRGPKREVSWSRLPALFQAYPVLWLEVPDACADNVQTKTIRIGPARVSLGDEQVTSGVLVGVNGQRAGSFGITCTLVAVHPKYTLERCHGWGQLARGQLTIAGASRSNTSHATWAITGGTGRYQTARGEIQLHPLNNHQTAVTVNLAGV